MIKIPKETKKECISTTKAIYNKTFCQHHTKWEKTKIICFKVRKKTRVSTPSTLVQYLLEFLAKEIRQDKK
jgi:hypothetical protein